MSTAAEQVKAAEELAKTITAIKGATETQGGKITGLEGKVEAAEKAMLKLNQAMEARHRADEEAKLGTESELGSYVCRSTEEVSAGQAASAVLKTEQGAIRLTGHWRTIIDQRTQARADIWQWGLLDDPNPRSKGQVAAQHALSRRNLARMHTIDPHGAKKLSPQADLELFDALRQCGADVTKIFANSTNIGAEWIPSTTVPELERAILVPTNFSAILRQRVVGPGTTVIPKRTGYLRLYRGAVPTTDNPADAILSSIGTDSGSLTSVPDVIASQVDRDAEADSILSIVDELMRDISEAARFADDDTVLHGDTAATHQDAIASWNTRGRLGSSGLGTTADHRRRALGLIPRAYDLTSMTTNDNAAQTWAAFKAGAAKLSADSMMMGHLSPGRVVAATSWEVFFSKILDWTEFASWEKVGALASILTGMVGGNGPGPMLPGQVGFFAGMIPLVIAYPLTADLASAGLYTGSGAYSGILTFDRDRFERVVRQGMVVESATEIRNNSVTYVARKRGIPIRAIDAVASTVKDAHWSFGWTF